MVDQLRTKLFAMGIHVSGKALTDEQPHHIWRKDKGLVLLVGFQHALVEGILLRILQVLCVGEACADDVVFFVKYRLVFAQDGFCQLVAIIKIPVLFYNWFQTFVNHEGDFPILCLPH